ncbi:hypothetical protein ACJX0J_012652, partial [Zea mays]
DDILCRDIGLGFSTMDLDLIRTPKNCETNFAPPQIKTFDLIGKNRRTHVCLSKIMIENNRTYVITLDHYCTTEWLLLSKEETRKIGKSVSLANIWHRSMAEAIFTQGLPQFLRQPY